MFINFSFSSMLEDCTPEYVILDDFNSTRGRLYPRYKSIPCRSVPECVPCTLNRNLPNPLEKGYLEAKSKLMDRPTIRSWVPMFLSAFFLTQNVGYSSQWLKNYRPLFYVFPEVRATNLKHTVESVLWIGKTFAKEWKFSRKQNYTKFRTNTHEI